MVFQVILSLKTARSVGSYLMYLLKISTENYYLKDEVAEVRMGFSSPSLRNLLEYS